ncbi:MAG: hypothetical protein ABEH66_02975 [Halobacteriales archaeon]
MYGVVTRNEEELDWPEFDRGFYEVKDVTGRASEPTASGVNTISCFADNAAAEGDPSLVPLSESGERATRERPYFDWSHVCPSREAYRRGLLETIEDCADASPDVRLDDVGFPRGEYCHCAACEEAFAESDHEAREDWRAATVTAFVAEAADRVPGRLSLAVHPDPYPGHLRERSGIDVEAVAPHVEEFVVPLYDTAYGTTYWLEALASGFADRIAAAGGEAATSDGGDGHAGGGDSGTEDGGVDLGVELYAVNIDVADLLEATDVAEAYADAVYFGYDSGTARAALRQRRAEAREGKSFGEPGQ